ncbi:MAG: hypothetical protein LBB76_00065 [Azoarcus sp.]|jgi:hypothetical protein|nr:hypothetical protein [Azoarcus sp.]
MRGKKNAAFGGFHGKAACLIACVMTFLFLLPGCGEKHTLRVEMTDATYGAPASFKFVDTSTGKEIFYTTLVFKGKKVHKAVAMSMGVYFAFDESQYQVEGNTTKFNDGTMITPAGTWKYTLTGAPECKPACELDIRE